MIALKTQRSEVATTCDVCGADDNRKCSCPRCGEHECDCNCPDEDADWAAENELMNRDYNQSRGAL